MNTIWQTAAELSRTQLFGMRIYYWEAESLSGIVLAGILGTSRRRVLGFLLTRAQQAPGPEGPSVVLANKN